jgi:hypothetical protein
VLTFRPGSPRDKADETYFRKATLNPFIRSSEASERNSSSSKCLKLLRVLDSQLSHSDFDDRIPTVVQERQAYRETGGIRRDNTTAVKAIISVRASMTRLDAESVST